MATDTKSTVWTIDDVRRMAPEAFKEAIARYPSDVEGALIFFGHAIGLGFGTPTDADIALAQKIIERHVSVNDPRLVPTAGSEKYQSFVERSGDASLTDPDMG